MINTTGIKEKSRQTKEKLIGQLMGRVAISKQGFISLAALKENSK